jgi:hypothetical protein
VSRFYDFSMIRQGLSSTSVKQHKLFDSVCTVSLVGLQAGGESQAASKRFHGVPVDVVSAASNFGGIGVKSWLKGLARRRHFQSARFYEKMQ